MRLWSTVLVLALALPGPPLLAAQPDDVVISLVARDKKGALVQDLRLEELEVLDDGAKQTVAELRRAEASEAVVLVFERLQGSARENAERAASELVKKQLAAGTPIAVVAAGSELLPVEAPDAASAQAAVKRALDPASKAGSLTPEALLSLVQGLKDRPGRKPVVLFSDGVSADSEELVTALAAVANRFRVSFYAVDPRGLEVAGRAMDVTGATGDEEVTGWMHGNLEERFGNVQKRTDPRWQDPRAGSGGGSGPEAALRAMADLTGGFMVERTNNFTPGLRRIAEDLQGAYELRYTPGAAKADGSIRRIQLKLAREGVQLQAGRDVLVGASATPPAPEFEKPLLAALQAETLPRGVPAWDRALHFAWDGKEVEHVLGVSVPLRGVALQEDKGAGQFRGEVAILARIKDASGRVVRSFSQEFPMVGPLDQLAGARSQTIRFVRRLGLAPGDYTLETAVRDAQADTLTARRTRIQARAPEGLAQSSVSLGDLKPAGSDAEDPFRIEKQRLVPNLGEPIQAGGSPMTLHCVVYPVRGSKEPATATFTLTSGSEVLMSQAAPLPAPGADGRIAYGSALRVDLIPPGTYQMKIAVAQGSSRAEESTSFTIVR